PSSGERQRRVGHIGSIMRSDGRQLSFYRNSLGKIRCLSLSNDRDQSMSRTPLTRWSFRVLHTEGVEHSDPAVTEVTIPHDAVLQSPRRSDPALTATGYFPGGAWEYTTVLRGPESWRQSRVALEFEAVYRSASVFVNGGVAGGWRRGASSFVGGPYAFLRQGAGSAIPPRMHAHRDSRWYSGGGLIRPVHLRVTDPVHIPLDGVYATTPEID